MLASSGATALKRYKYDDKMIYHACVFDTITELRDTHQKH